LMVKPVPTQEEEPAPKARQEPASPLPGDDQTPGESASMLRLSFRASASQLFRILPALQNLSDRSAKFSVRAEVEAEGKEPFDPTWLRNAVNEHMNEAGVEAESKLE